MSVPNSKDRIFDRHLVSTIINLQETTAKVRCYLQVCFPLLHSNVFDLKIETIEEANIEKRKQTEKIGNFVVSGKPQRWGLSSGRQ